MDLGDGGWCGGRKGVICRASLCVCGGGGRISDLDGEGLSGWKYGLSCSI